MRKLLLIFVLFLSNIVNAKTIEGLVVGVADGDTITLLDQQKNTYKIRLQGIDAPEKKLLAKNPSKACTTLCMASSYTLNMTKKTSTAA